MCIERALSIVELLLKIMQGLIQGGWCIGWLATPFTSPFMRHTVNPIMLASFIVNVFNTYDILTSINFNDFINCDTIMTL